MDLPIDNTDESIVHSDSLEEQWEIVSYPHPERECTVIVYRNSHGGLYLDASNIAWCLGYDYPEEIIRELISENLLLSGCDYELFINGPMLTEEGVYELLDRIGDVGFGQIEGLEKEEFREWFQQYVQKLENKK